MIRPCGPSSLAGDGALIIGCCIQKDVFSSFCLAPEGRFCYDHKTGFHVVVISSGNFRRWPICCPQAGFGQEKVLLVFTVSKTKAHFQARQLLLIKFFRDVPLGSLLVKGAHSQKRQCFFVMWMLLSCVKCQCAIPLLLQFLRQT